MQFGGVTDGRTDERNKRSRGVLIVCEFDKK